MCIRDRHEIVVGISRDEKQLMLTVKDYGTGIPSEIREKLFKQMITSKGNMGTGLGVFKMCIRDRGQTCPSPYCCPAITSARSSLMIRAGR